MYLYSMFFIVFICAGCSGGLDKQNFNLDNGFYYVGELLSFDNIGTYSTESFALSFSQSSAFSVLDEDLSDEDIQNISLIGILLSDYLENAIIKFLNFKYRQVEGYSIEYTTLDINNNEEEVKVSGLVIAPSTSKPLPLLIYLRPTILEKDYAPSLMPASLVAMDPLYDDRFMMVSLALQGYIVLVPDYIGYGSSEDMRHPYLHKKSDVQTVISMLHSAVDALNEEAIPFQKQLFIMGYSQGAYGALAFSQAIQNSSLDFTIKAVAAGGGPYDLLHTVEKQLEQETVERRLIALLLQSYSYIYGWDLNNIVQKQTYADIISSVYKYDSLSEAIEELPDKTRSLFRSEFIQDIHKKSSSYNQFQSVLKENSVYDWTPDFPLLLFHGKEDQIVPYSNMGIAYRSFNTGRGANVHTKDCDFRKVEDLLDAVKIENKALTKTGHVNCNFMFFFEIDDYFSSYQ